MKPQDRYERIQQYLKGIREGTLSQIELPNLEGHIEILYNQLLAKIEQARTDALTGLPNYRGLIEILEREEARSKRYKEPLTLGFADFDNLKPYNDTYGHIQANHAIKSVSETIKGSLRKQDILARYGGDEFCFVLPNTDLENSKIVVDRIIKSVDSLSIDNVVDKLPDNGYERVVISMGCTQLKGNEEYISALDRANIAMKDAKAKPLQISSVIYK